MAVNINKYDDDALFIYGQVPITKEEYKQLEADGVDLSFVLPPGSISEPSAIGDKTPENDISIMMESIVEVLEELTDNNKDVQYEYGAGHDSTEYSPYDQGKTRLDEDAFLGWTAYELGYVDSEIAIQPTSTILESLIRVSLDSTSDDTEDYKISIIDSTVNIGDIIMFDTPIKNGLAGFYLGSGEFITLFTQDNDDINDIYKLYLWETDEDDGSIVPTEWLSRFNGGVYRTELLDSEAYKWYNSTINN